MTQALPSDLWHAPNEMQLIENDGTPKHEMQKRVLISDGGMTRPTLTVGTIMMNLCKCYELFKTSKLVFRYILAYFNELQIAIQINQ